MFKVLTCVSGEHEWLLVALAAAFCVASTLTAFGLWGRIARRRHTALALWLTVIGAIAGSGIWATHFIAMLAFKPGLRTGYEPLPTLASLLIAVAFASIAFAVARIGRRWGRCAAGGLLGAGIGLMHYTGMAGFRTQGWLEWDRAYVAASLAIGVGLSIAAFFVAGSGATAWRRGVAGGVLTLAICGLHFTAMAAVTLVPDAAIAAPTAIMSRPALALWVSGLTGLVCITAASALAIAVRSRRKASQRLREAMDVMPEALAVFDAADRLVAWNQRYEAMMTKGQSHLQLGQSYAEVVAASLGVHTDLDVEGRAAWTRRHVERRRNEPAVQKQWLLDGRWMRIEHRPTASGGLLTLAVDVTDLKRQADALAKARDEADSANRAKSEFLANMSHEIRTPMNGVIGMTDLLLRTPLRPNQRKFAETVRSSAECLMTVVNDILDVSKLESGAVELDVGDLNLETLIEDAVELMSAPAAEKSLEIGAFVYDGARRGLRGDAARLRQVVQNLLSNGVKFTDHGFVAIEATSRPAADGRVRIRVDVSDTGPGVAPEVKAKLFRTFQQADGSSTRRYGGTGLGLSICRQLVELMGGTIGVDDRPGGGSVFWIELTLDRAQGEGSRVPTAPTLAGARVLVAEDGEMTRRLFVRQLARAGAAVETADDGGQAHSAIERAHDAGAPFDVVLMSRTLPGRSWDAAARRARGGPPRLVLICPIDEPLGEPAAARLGFDAVLIKPVRRAQLEARLAALCDRDDLRAGATRIGV
jgi:signal transduction histidine kinase